MTTDVDERVPQGGASLLTVFAIPGLFLGLVEYGLSRLIRGADDASIAEAALMALVIGGLAYFLTVFTKQVLRSVVSAFGLALATGILYFVAQGGQGAEMSDRVIPVVANFGILAVALPFLRAASRDRPLTDYPLLYADAWAIPAIGAISMFFLLVGSALAALVGALFAFIGLEFIRDLMAKPWFMSGYGAMLFAVGVGVVRQRESAVLAARGILMALLRVTAPVFAVCMTVFVVALTLRGYTSLPGDLSPVATLTAAAVVSIILINAIVGDAGRPESVLFGAAERLLAVLLVFLMALAVNGLIMRVGSEGWTPNRIAAAIAMLVVALYAPIYFIAGLTEQWQVLRQGNIAISALLIVIAIFVQTPFFRPYDWSVKSQLRIMAEDIEAVTDRDLAYLRDDLSAPGMAAYEELASGTGPLAEKAKALPEDLPPERALDYADRLDEAIESGAVRTYPDGLDLSRRLSSEVAMMMNYRDAEDAVIVLQGDRYYVLVIANGEIEVGQFDETGRELARRQTVTPEDPSAVLDEAAANGLRVEERTYALPVLEGTILPPNANELDDFEVDLPLVDFPDDLVTDGQTEGVLGDAPSDPLLTPTDPLGEEAEPVN
ncbi:MAG: DUF4153 domain-containing protein [Pseudomonadota bacterium]